MNAALISGEDRAAVFQDGVQMWCIRPQSPSPQLISPGLLPYVFENISGANYYLEATLESTRRLLERACREERGLQLALISMDPVSSKTTRELAEDALEEFLEDQYVSEFIENRLFSNPLPDAALWRNELSSGDFQAYPRVGRMKRSVAGGQEAIRQVKMAWDALPADLFSKPEDRIALESILVETGAFRILSIAVGETVHRFSKGNAQLSLLADPRYQTFANSRNILTRWTTTIPSPSHASGQLIRDERDQEELHHRREQDFPKVASHEAFQNVNVQKEAILEQLGRRNFQ